MNSQIDAVVVADVVSVAVVVEDVVAEPTRIVGTRVLTLEVLETPIRLLIYSGELTVSV